MRNSVAREGKRHVGFPGKARGLPGQDNWRPLKPIFFKLFQSGTGLAKVLRAGGQIADDFRGNFLACAGILSFLAPYVRLFQ